MRLSTFFSAILIAFSFQVGIGQAWVKTIDKDWNEKAWAVIEMPDSDLVFTGQYCQSPLPPCDRMIVCRTDKFGNVKWFRNDYPAQIGSLIAQRANKIYVVGEIRNVSSEPFDHIGMVLNELGEIIHADTFGKSYPFFQDLGFASNGDILVSGYSEYSGHKPTVFRLDSLFGEKQQIISGNIDEGGFAARETPEGFIQQIKTDRSAQPGISICRFDSVGNLVSEKKHQFPWFKDSKTLIKGTIQAPDGGYYIVCEKSFPLAGPPYADLHLVKTDAGGDLDWEQKVFSDNYIFCTAATQLKDGKIILRGGKRTDIDAFNSLTVVVSKDGHYLGHEYKNRNTVSSDSIFCLTPTMDGGMVACGKAAEVDMSFTLNDSLLLIKYDSIGFPIFERSIDGQVFLDGNMDCMKNQSDTSVFNQLIRVAGPGGNFFATTDSAGSYKIYLPDGQFSVELISASPYFKVCPVLPTIILSPQNDSVTQDFGLKTLIDCPYLTSELTIPRLRRCFTNSASVHFCNLGTIPATDAHLDLTLDPWLELTAAGQPFTALGGNILRFELGTMAVFECRDIALTIKVDCDSTIIGQTHCVEAHIFPDSSCLPPTATWSGASIEVGATCTGDTLHFSIQNTGTAPTSVPCDFIVIEDDVIMNVGQQTLGIDETVALEFPADGHFWRLEASQEPGHPGQSMPTVSVEGCGGWWPGSFGFWTAFPQDDGSPAVDIDCLQNIGSYDPNEKTAAPEGIDNERFIQKNTDIEYTIHFQNTGTDTAFTVVVLDTIDQKLRPETLKLGGASHPFSYEIYGPGILKMSFEKIDLPDSTTNLAGSQGWFSYRISQKTNLADGSKIRNRAAIIFDFNAPILTNRTLHTIGTKFLSVKTWSPVQPDLQLSVFPNPTSDGATFLIKGDGIRDGDALVLQLFDVHGRLVLAKDFTKNTAVIGREGLVGGLYFFKITKGSGPECSGAVGAGKLLIE